MSEYTEIECNGRIIREIADDMNISIGTVEDIIRSVSSFTADTIRMGGLEGVMIPYLGKIHVKPYSQQYKDYLHSLGKEMKGYLKSNKKAAEILFDLENDDEDETIHT